MVPYRLPHPPSPLRTSSPFPSGDPIHSPPFPDPPVAFIPFAFFLRPLTFHVLIPLPAILCVLVSPMESLQIIMDSYSSTSKFFAVGCSTAFPPPSSAALSFESPLIRPAFSLPMPCGPLDDSFLSLHPPSARRRFGSGNIGYPRARITQRAKVNFNPWGTRNAASASRFPGA